jgi:hypothetical protein
MSTPNLGQMTAGTWAKVIGDGTFSGINRSTVPWWKTGQRPHVGQQSPPLQPRTTEFVIHAPWTAPAGIQITALCLSDNLSFPLWAARLTDDFTRMVSTITFVDSDELQELYLYAETLRDELIPEGRFKHIRGQA